MSTPITYNLNPVKGLIFRITHRDNILWILDHGLHCPNGTVFDHNFVPIGNPELIDRRHHREVPIPPGGVLGDYVPFYFTPYSPMMYNIKTGYGGVKKRRNDEIVVLVSSLHQVAKEQRKFVFTDRHAYLRAANFYNNINDLNLVDFKLLRSRDFSRDVEDPEKIERYQAEALVHQSLPVQALLGIVCYTKAVADEVQSVLRVRKITMRTLVKPSWYF
ncbi:conserved hypothetical protein [Nitrosococcus halophilus Nc 4]|uniref:DarT domain-containing protein n=1 Tax=Nitrosococcus halophilus (strain Nc4) TaxID=472759 RepID=D5C184_NITHN|nr:DUF4433 domain-containing protein [Nitrosococcus halophilus]ADE16436.1 conserved hypothetical protein [Nitrosococcus halophilus Nc 4]